ncbi:MAG: Asp-tRNA(Asn)/Glu-tRNA(Gln) amidotransferase subunit GatC, partial [Planctomycetota bacterium]
SMSSSMPNPPPIDRALLQQLAELSRLHLPQDRQAMLLARLQRVLSAFEALRDMSTGEAAPTPYRRPLPMTLRVDVAEAPLPVEKVLANAPRCAAGSFVVPRVVDG